MSRSQALATLSLAVFAALAVSVGGCSEPTAVATAVQVIEVKGDAQAYAADGTAKRVSVGDVLATTTKVTTAADGYLRFVVRENGWVSQVQSPEPLLLSTVPILRFAKTDVSVDEQVKSLDAQGEIRDEAGERVAAAHARFGAAKSAGAELARPMPKAEAASPPEVAGSEVAAERMEASGDVPAAQTLGKDAAAPVASKGGATRSAGKKQQQKREKEAKDERGASDPETDQRERRVAERGPAPPPAGGGALSAKPTPGRIFQPNTKKLEVVADGAKAKAEVADDSKVSADEEAPPPLRVKVSLASSRAHAAKMWSATRIRAQQALESALGTCPAMARKLRVELLVDEGGGVRVRPPAPGKKVPRPSVPACMEKALDAWKVHPALKGEILIVEVASGL